MKERIAAHKNVDDRGVQGVILTMSDGRVFWAVYVSVTWCQHTADYNRFFQVIITSKFHDLIYC